MVRAKKTILGRSVRMARLKDSDAVVIFLRTTSKDFPRPLDEKVEIERYVAKMIRCGSLLVAESSSDEIMGVAGGYCNDESTFCAYLSVIVAGSASRGTGSSQRLLRAFEAHALRSGMLDIRLETHETNSRALAFYRKNGYAVVGSAKTKDDVLLGKPLSGLSRLRPNILLTSAGRRTYLVDYFKEALAGEGKVHAVNSTAQCPAFSAADEWTVCPEISDENYITFLLEYCQRNGIGAVIPLFDVDIPVLAVNKAAFEKIGCRAIVVNENIARACNDKLDTARFLAENDINHPRTSCSLEDCINRISAGKMHYPVIAKPRWGMGSIGVWVAHNEEELRVFSKYIHREAMNTYLKHESSIDEDNCVVIQEKLDGQEYGMDIMNDLEGRFVGVSVRLKEAMRSGETDCARAVPADGEYLKLAKRLSALTGHPGNLDIDIFDIDGELYVLEMNARFGGGYPFSHVAGVNLPKALVEWLKGNDEFGDNLEPTRFGVFQKDIRVIPLKVLKST